MHSHFVRGTRSKMFIKTKIHGLNYKTTGYKKKKQAEKSGCPSRIQWFLKRVWSGGDGKEEPLLMRQKEEFQFLSMSAPETWFLNLFHQETGPWHCTKRPISPHSMDRLSAWGEYILYFECTNLNICKWDCLEQQQSQGKQFLFLFKKQVEIKVWGFSSAMGDFQTWDFISAFIAETLLVQHQEFVPEWTQNLSQKLTLEMLNLLPHLNPQAMRREKWEWEGKSWFKEREVHSHLRLLISKSSDAPHLSLRSPSHCVPYRLKFCIFKLQHTYTEREIPSPGIPKGVRSRISGLWGWEMKFSHFLTYF